MNNTLKGKVLVIDDEIGPRESLRILLKTQYEIITADRVDAGIEKLREHSPDLIIMDIRMPDKTGIEGLREIREINQTVSVIMLTGYGALETAQEAIRHGANDYLKKPFDMNEIQTVVAKNVARSRLETRKTNAENQINELSERLNTTLKKRDNMTEMGLASAELVHDLRNPLTVVRGYIELLKIEMQQLSEQTATPEITEYLVQIESQLKRCTQLTEDWYNLGKNAPDHLIPVNLPELIGGLSDGIRHIHPDVEIELPALGEPERFSVLADNLQIYRVFQNILSNAVQAMQNADQKQIKIHYECTERMITTVIKDNGCGIDPEKIQWIFNPLSSFRQTTTKGLGLFITKKIIESHNGTIQVESLPDQGTIIRVSLPSATN